MCSLTSVRGTPCPEVLQVIFSCLASCLSISFDLLSVGQLQWRWSKHWPYTTRGFFLGGEIILCWHILTSFTLLCQICLLLKRGFVYKRCKVFEGRWMCNLPVTYIALEINKMRRGNLWWLMWHCNMNKLLLQMDWGASPVEKEMPKKVGVVTWQH